MSEVTDTAGPAVDDATDVEAEILRRLDAAHLPQPVTDAPSTRDDVRPPAAYLRRVSVAGSGGIGPQAVLDITPARRADRTGYSPPRPP